MNKDNVLHVPIGSLAKYQIQDLYQLLQQVSEQLEQAKKLENGFCLPLA